MIVAYTRKRNTVRHTQGIRDEARVWLLTDEVDGLTRFALDGAGRKMGMANGRMFVDS